MVLCMLWSTAQHCDAKLVTQGGVYPALYRFIARRDDQDMDQFASNPPLLKHAEVCPDGARRWSVSVVRHADTIGIVVSGNWNTGQSTCQTRARVQSICCPAAARRKTSCASGDTHPSAGAQVLRNRCKEGTARRGKAGNPALRWQTPQTRPVP